LVSTEFATEFEPIAATLLDVILPLNPGTNLYEVLVLFESAVELIGNLAFDSE
jgi:hypothetical protein